MNEPQAAFDFVSAPVLRQAGRREFVLRVAAENREKFRADFYDWLKEDANYYGVWTRFDEEASRIHARGRGHYSARTIGEFLRHETAARAANDGDFKVNDHRWPDLARLWLLLDPKKREGFFELRGRAA